MKAWLIKLFAEDNGSDICIAKLMAAAAFLSYLGYAAWGAYKGDLHLDAFANGLMQTLAGCATVIAGKNITTKAPRDGNP